MDCACLFLEICGYYYYKKGVYAQVIRSTLDDAFESGNTVPHEHVCIRKIKKTLEIAEIY